MQTFTLELKATIEKIILYIIGVTVSLIWLSPNPVDKKAKWLSSH